MIADGNGSKAKSGNFQAMRAKARSGRLGKKTKPVSGDSFHAPMNGNGSVVDVLPKEISGKPIGRGVNMPGTGDS